MEVPHDGDWGLVWAGRRGSKKKRSESILRIRRKRLLRKKWNFDRTLRHFREASI